MAFGGTQALPLYLKGLGALLAGAKQDANERRQRAVRRKAGKYFEFAEGARAKLQAELDKQWPEGERPIHPTSGGGFGFGSGSGSGSGSGLGLGAGGGGQPFVSPGGMPPVDAGGGGDGAADDALARLRARFQEPIGTPASSGNTAGQCTPWWPPLPVCARPLAPALSAAS